MVIFDTVKLSGLKRTKLSSQIIAAGFWAIAASSPVAAQTPDQQTPENAHKFLALTLRGQEMPHGWHADHVGHRSDEIFFVTSVQSSDCVTKVWSAPEDSTIQLIFEISWSSVGETVAAADNIVVIGGVKDRSSEPDSTFNGRIMFTAPGTFQRIVTAMRVLQASCDRSSGLGF